MLIILAFIFLCIWIGSFFEGSRIMQGGQIPMKDEREGRRQ